MVGGAALAGSLAWIASEIDGDALAATVGRAVDDPAGLAAAVALYALAFFVRALAWQRALPALRLGHALAAIHVALAGNHLLPLRLGEPLRPLSAASRSGVPLSAATASTLMLRGSDLVAAVALVGVLVPVVVTGRPGSALWLAAPLAVAIWVAGILWLRRLGRRGALALRVSPGVTLAAALVAWIAESAVLWQAAGWAEIALSPLEALAVTGVAVVAQVVAIAPGGVGTYEAAAAGALVALGADPGSALAAAVAAHAVKTAYALIAGALALVRPGHGALGRLRVDRHPPAVAPPSPPGAGPVLVFLPAHDEEATVAEIVTRAPARVRGRDVVVLVVDDGSCDRTAELARSAGAHVVSVPARRGLGAAVRRGLQEAVSSGAAAVAFCDADGEYAPEELERLVGPILDGRADYVVGSRFVSFPRRMRVHRQLGNRLLSAVLSWVVRRPIGDGQSGYRALSARAAASARIPHDYNYAQVLTVGLVAAGFGYLEVPISYARRRHGRSFVRLGEYLSRVVPAVHAQLNAQSSTTAAVARSRAAAHARPSIPSGVSAAAAANASASAKCELSWLKSPPRPSEISPGRESA